MKYKTVHSRGKKRVITRVVNLGSKPYAVTDVELSAPISTSIRLKQHSNVILIFAIDADVEVDSQLVPAGQFLRMASPLRGLQISVHRDAACLLIEIPGESGKLRSIVQTSDKGCYSLRCAYWLERIRVLLHREPANHVELCVSIRNALSASTTHPAEPSVVNHVDISGLLLFELYPSTDFPIRTIADASRSLGIKTYRLKQLLREIYDCTAHNWIMAVKMNISLNLLQNKQLTLQFIASQAGYRLEENFIIAFRNYFGITPHAFRTRVHHLP